MGQRNTGRLKSAIRLTAIVVLFMALGNGVRLALRSTHANGVSQAGVANARPALTHELDVPTEVVGSESPQDAGVLSISPESVANARSAPAHYPDVPPEVMDNVSFQENRQEVKGVTLRASNFYRLDRFVYAEVCVQTGRPGLWEIFRSRLAYANGVSDNYVIHFDAMLRIDPPDPQDEQCMMLQYAIPDDADLSDLTLTVENLVMATPDEGQMCAEFDNRIRQSQLGEKGIETACEEGAGYAGVTVVGHAPAMSRAEAEELVTEAIFPQLDGPWVISGSATK